MKKILGYTDKITVRPGEEVAFKISGPEGALFKAQLVRLINGDTHSKRAHFKEIEVASEINGSYSARSQSIAPGSCVVVEEAHALLDLQAFTLQLEFMSTTPQLGLQHLIGVWDQSLGAGWSMQIDQEGRLAFIAADSLGCIDTLVVRPALVARKWYRASVRVSWQQQIACLNCAPIMQLPLEAVAERTQNKIALACGRPTVGVPLLIGAAFGGYSLAGHCIPASSFNGRIERPVIYEGLLTDNELEDISGGERPGSLDGLLVADWNFSLEMNTTTIRDCSRNRLDGFTHNLPLRGVRGSKWDSAELHWCRAPEQYGAIHFHTDDLYDCGWQTSILYRIPEDLRGGVYALRLRLGDGAGLTVKDPQEEYLPFFVAPPRDQARAELAFLVPTFTYLAYANVRVEDAKREESGLSAEEYYAANWTGPGIIDYSVLLAQHPNLGSSTYDYHLDASPVHTSSWLRPILNFRPKSVLWTFCADLLITDWLEAKGTPYDIITDDLLQREGVSLLERYRVVMTGNHPEYHTTEQLDSIEFYLRHGGRLMYMGGNGFYWRCATSPSLPAAIEVRRGRTGTGTWKSDAGEDFFSFTGECGGIWRDLGRPPQRLTGVGFIGQGRDASHYRILRDPESSRGEFILKGVESDVVGDFGIFGAAAGQEIDKSSSVLGTPSHAVVVARSEDHGPNMLYVIEEMQSVDPVVAHYRQATCAEVVFFDTPSGGAVFSVGSMAWCGSLGHNGYDNDISKISENALRRLLEPTPFELPEGA